MPGSGNLPLNCDDGGFGDAYSVDFKMEVGGLYATAAWEEHRAVNRNSDGHRLEPSALRLPAFDQQPAAGLSTLSNAYGAEFPGYLQVASPAYLTDIGDETAYKNRRQIHISLRLVSRWHLGVDAAQYPGRHSNSRTSGSVPAGGSRLRRTCSARGTISASGGDTRERRRATRVESITTTRLLRATRPICTRSRGGTIRQAADLVLRLRPDHQSRQCAL